MLQRPNWSYQFLEKRLCLALTFTPVWNSLTSPNATRSSGCAPDCFERSYLPAHFTGSVMLVNASGSKTLLYHHQKLDK